MGEKYKHLKEYNFYSKVDSERSLAGLSGKYLSSFFTTFMIHLFGVLPCLLISSKLIIVLIGSLIYFYRRLVNREKQYGATGIEKEQAASHQVKKIKYNTL